MAVAPVHETANGTDSLEPPLGGHYPPCLKAPEVDEWAVSKLLKWTHVDVARHKLNPTQQRQRRVQLDCDTGVPPPIDGGRETQHNRPSRPPAY